MINDYYGKTQRRSEKIKQVGTFTTQTDSHVLKWVQIAM